MQRPGSWLTVVAAIVVVGGLALVARMLLSGDSANPPGPAPTPVAQPPAPPPKLADPATVAPQGTRSEEPKPGPRPDPNAAREGPPGRIFGRVVDPNHEPVANAEVELVQGPAVMMQLRQLAKETGIVANTDSKGEYRLADVPPADDYIVYASHPEFGDSEAGPIVVRASADARVGDIVLRVGVHVTGHVNADGRPLEGAIVTLSNQMDVLRKMRPTPPSSPDQRELKLATHTDASGSYNFASVPFDRFALTAEAGGFARISKTTPNQLGGAPRDQTIDFDMVPAVAIRGRVIDEKKNPLAGAKVSAALVSTAFNCDQSATSDASGAFLLDALAQGQYHVSAECDGYTMGTKPQVEAGGAEIEIQLQIQGRVTGVVVDEETGRPVTDFDVTVVQSFKNRGPAPTRVHQRVHDSAGRFELKNLDPGLFQIQGKAAGYADSLSDEFQVVRGQETSNVRVPMNRGGTVIGSVVDKSGRPVAEAEVILRTNKMKDNPINEIFKNVAAGDPEQKVRADADGRFKIELVVPGTYQLAVRQSSFAGFEQNDVEVRRNETTDAGKLVMSQGAKVRGHVFGFDGKPLPGAVVNAVTKSGDFKTARSDNDGAFVLTALAPGDYTLSISQFPSSPPMDMLSMIVVTKNSQTPVSLADGDDSSVDLHLTKK